VARAVPDWNALQGAVSGEVVLTGSPGYDSTRKPAIARFDDARPQALVLCGTHEDVAETISFARRSGLRTATRSGGHCFAGRSSTEGIVIDVTPMHSVSVSGGVASVGAGARLGDVYDSLEEHGLTIPAVCGPTLGISGLTLGGGLGILGRKHGLTSDSNGCLASRASWTSRLGAVRTIGCAPTPQPSSTARSSS
jgi:FAD/FMN-containing dehydrogenase